MKTNRRVSGRKCERNTANLCRKWRGRPKSPDRGQISISPHSTWTITIDGRQSLFIKINLKIKCPLPNLNFESLSNRGGLESPAGIVLLFLGRRLQPPLLLNRCFDKKNENLYVQLGLVAYFLFEDRPVEFQKLLLLFATSTSFHNFLQPLMISRAFDCADTRSSFLVFSLRFWVC